MIIAGWGKDAKPIAWIGYEKCPNCKNMAHMRVYQTERKATAFFVPVAKWDKKHYLVCGTCSAALELDEHGVAELLAASAVLPGEDEFVAIWNDMDTRISAAGARGAVDQAVLVSIIQEMQQVYPEAWVQYAFKQMFAGAMDNDRPK